MALDKEVAKTMIVNGLNEYRMKIQELRAKTGSPLEYIRYNAIDATAEAIIDYICKSLDEADGLTQEQLNEDPAPAAPVEEPAAADVKEEEPGEDPVDPAPEEEPYKGVPEESLEVDPPGPAEEEGSIDLSELYKDSD